MIAHWFWSKVLGDINDRFRGHTRHSFVFSIVFALDSIILIRQCLLLEAKWYTFSLSTVYITLNYSPTQMLLLLRALTSFDEESLYQKGVLPAVVLDVESLSTVHQRKDCENCFAIRLNMPCLFCHFPVTTGSCYSNSILLVWGQHSRRSYTPFAQRAFEQEKSSIKRILIRLKAPHKT